MEIKTVTLSHMVNEWLIENSTLGCEIFPSLDAPASVRAILSKENLSIMTVYDDCIFSHVRTEFLRPEDPDFFDNLERDIDLFNSTDHKAAKPPLYYYD